MDEISSYQNKKDLSYLSILESLQFLYVPLNLELFQNLVLSYKIEEGETFLEFSSRCYRHLKLCSRLKTPAERENYVETHRCSILKKSLSPEILTTIIRKEQIFRAF